MDRWHRGWAIGRRNDEGECAMEMAQVNDLALLNTFVQKKGEHLITLKSWRNTSVTDSI